MGSVPDYGYRSAEEGWSHSYLVDPVLRSLHGVALPVLDLGCGNGAMARALMAAGYDVYGVDSAISGIQLASATHPGRFFRMDVESELLPEPLSNLRFGAVLSTEVIEHLYDPKALLRLAARVLQASGGGRLVVSTPYHGYVKNLAIALAGQFDSHFTVHWDGGHIKFFSRRTLGKMLREVGFRPTQFVGAGRLPLLWKSMVVSAEIAS